VQHRVRYNTERFELLVGGELHATDVDGLGPTGKIELGPRGQQREYRRFEAGDLRPGQRLSARVAVGEGSPVIRIAGLIAAATAAAAIIGFPFLRRRFGK
jgi:hypothetical protein